MTPIQQAIAAWFLINGIFLVTAMLLGDWRAARNSKMTH